MARRGSRVTWRHQARDRFESYRMPFPIGAPLKPSLYSRFRDIKPQTYRCHDLGLSGSRDIGHVTIRFAIWYFLLVVHWNLLSICSRFRDIPPQQMFKNSRTRMNEPTNQQTPRINRPHGSTDHMDQQTPRINRLHRSAWAGSMARYVGLSLMGSSWQALYFKL